MDLLNILKEIEKVDGEVYERLNPRRKAMQRFAAFGRKLTLAALPLALGSIFKRAYAQASTVDVEDALQFALQLEYLESEFYTQALASAVLIPAGTDRAAITSIRDHENQHVAFLSSTLQALGLTPVIKPTFDFSGGKGSSGGPFADVFLNFGTFLTVAQSLEDIGVRAYKGQLPSLVGNSPVLSAVLKIHSVEARHASHIRQMRKALGADVKPWITNNESGIGATLQPAYEGEELDVQGGIKITAINGTATSAAAATAAFDEPLTREQVLAVAGPFIV